MKRSARALESGARGTVVEVEIIGPSGCARCARGQGCGAGIFNQGMAPVRLICLSEYPVNAGEELVVEFDDGGAHWLWLVCGAYGLPLAGLMAATVITSFYLPGEAFSQTVSGALHDLVLAAAALLGLAGGVIAWRMVAPRVLLHLEKQLGLQTGRIVAAGTVPLNPAVLSRPTCPTRENP